MATQNSAAFSGSKCSARNQPKPAVTLSRNEMCSWPSVYTDSATGATTAVTCAPKKHRFWFLAWCCSQPTLMTVTKAHVHTQGMPGRLWAAKFAGKLGSALCCSSRVPAITVRRQASRTGAPCRRSRGA